MFILDTVTAGTLQIGYNPDSSYNTRKPTEIAEITEGQNIRFPILGGINDDGAFNVWAVSGSGSGLSWNRMSDGTLVEARNCGFSADVNLITGRSQAQANHMSVEVAYPIVVGNTYSYSDNGGVTDFYSKVNIDGGEYNVGVLMLGQTQNDFESSDYYKYVVGSGINNWQYEHYTTSNFVGSGYATSQYNAIDLSGNYFRTSKGTYNFNDTWGTGARDCSWRLVAYPTGTPSTITPEQTDFGTITEPESIVLQTTGTPTVTISYDDGPEEALTPGIGNVTVDLTSKWESLPMGPHTAIVRAKLNGYTSAAKITFTKSSSVVSVTTKPHSSVERPLMCRIVDDVTASAGANVSRSVTNNANDDNPVWEPFTGDYHVFSNATKTASTWGLAARVSVDNSDGTSNAEIKSAIALGVLYEQEV